MISIDYKDWFINQKRIPDAESKEAEKFFEFHKRLATEGFMMNGIFINPFLYWHLNFWHTEIDVIDERGVIHQKYINPYFRDNEWIISNAIHKANEERKGLIIAGIRRLSKSVTEASYIAWGATFDENSQNVISGLNSPDIKLITDKLDKGLNHLPWYYRWDRIEDNWKQQVTLGIRGKSGERYPFSYILIRNLDDGNNEEAIAGTKPRKLVIDEGAKGPYLKALMAAIPGFTTTYGWGCSPIVCFTGGDAKRFGDAKQMMFDCDAFNFLEFENKNNPLKKHGLFINHVYRLEAKEESTLGAYLGKPELSHVRMQVSNAELAEKITNDNLERAKKSGDRATYLKEKMYYPKTVDDIFLNEDTNIYDIEMARRQKMRLLSLEKTGTPVILYLDEQGRIMHEFTDKMPITSFPSKPTDDKDAPVMIYEFPVESPPYGLYVAGCLTPGEKVLTDKGLKSIEDITLSDKLINEEGKFVDIYNLQRYYKSASPVFDLKICNSYRKTRFTGEHPILVSDPYGNKAEPVNESRFDFKYVPVRDLKVGQWIKYPNIFKERNSFDIDILWDSKGYRIDRYLDSPLKNKNFWWFIGLFLGDGWCESNGYKITVSLNRNEYKSLYRLTKIINDLFNRKVGTRIRGGAIEVTFSCQQLSSFISNHINKGALNKSIPDWMKRIDEVYKYELLLGYLDSDGCVYRDKKRGYFSIEFVSVSLELLEDIQDIFFSIGYVSSISKLRDKLRREVKKGKISDILETYHLRIGNNATIRFWKHFDRKVSHKLSKISIDNIVSTVNSPKKGCFLSSDERYIYFKISKIEVSAYSGWVYNFECDTHTYICRGITTHNCDPYRQGKAAYSTSLGVIYIYKRMHNIMGEKYQDMFVASYAARPDKKEKWEEQARLLIKYYNARVLCENDEISFIEYMKAKGDAYYLEKQPGWLKEIVPNTTVTREFGIHRSADKIRDYLNTCLKRYTEEVVYSEKDEEGKVLNEQVGMYRILDPMLLEEMIQFNEVDNFDRIVAASLAIAQAVNMDAIIGRVTVNDSVIIKSLYSREGKPSLFSERGGMFNRRRQRIFV